MHDSIRKKWAEVTQKWGRVSLARRVLDYLVENNIKAPRGGEYNYYLVTTYLQKGTGVKDFDEAVVEVLKQIVKEKEDRKRVLEESMAEI